MSLNLTAAGLADQKAWEAAGYALPSYDREAMITRTKESPCWVHFGAGNIFRAFQANTAQELLNNGTFDRGVIVAEGFDTEIIRDMYQPHDNLSILVTLKADGSVEKTIVGSIAESLAADTADSPDFARLKEIFTNSLQMATFTITEKGYSLKNGAGELLPSVAADFAAGPSSVTSYMGKVASLLYERFLAGEKPVAMVSTDNCSHNGEKLSLALTAYASAWEENKLVQPGFLSYLQNPEKVSFPWTMIDKITPRPDASIEKMLEEDGLADAQPIVTSRHTYVAPFVNAEECQYLVVEDHFPNGRPPMEKSGWIFTDRETVNKTERMKDEIKNPVLKKLVERIGYVEGLPVVTDPGILSPKQFIDEVLNIRIPNPFMPDTPQRIATDTSQKLSIRFGETIKSYLASPELSLSDLQAIPAVFAGWLRYLMGVDDNGDAFELSPDPLLATVRPYVQDLKLGAPADRETLSKTLAPLLSDASIFGVDLISAGLSDRVLNAFVSMLQGPGAVADTLAALTAQF